MQLRHTLLGQVCLQLVDDISAAYKGQSIVVHAHVNAELQVQPVLVCDGWQVCTLASDVQVSPAVHPKRSGLVALGFSLNYREKV